MRRRILVLLSPNGDAMKRDVYETIARFKSDDELEALVGRSDRDVFGALVPVQPWNPSGLLGNIRASKRMRETVERFDPDIIHAHGYAAASLALGPTPGDIARRVVVTLHAPLRGKELPEKYFDERFGEFLSRAGALIAAYPTLARALERKFALPDGSFAVIPHAIGPMLDGEVARPAGRAGPIVGWYGPHVADRAWETAIDAFALVRRTHAEARFVIGGAGPATTLVRARVREKKIDRFVEFQSDGGPRDIFTRVDLMAMPGALDAQPHVLLEALAWGIPIVAGNVAGLADALDEVATGWLVPDDAEGIADGIRAAWSDIDRAWAGAMAQRARARERYARETTLGEVRAVYEGIAASGTGASLAL